MAEPIIQQRGNDRIVVLPGVQDTARARNPRRHRHPGIPAGGRGNDWTQAAATGRIPLNSRLYKDREGRPVLLQNG